ncbi:hypothetical protein BO83DRAFT_383088 [Aspergillus eucalypticola CBS 122712]|uniref:Uncharacterized protein n=1 Tax=Aspergillus eucalypticola (strain CBS 122712 / IBT 29274) TaxID=1448314 RepID=A0A317UMA2_ASPEC|nr:uncharacterized protein BO83DRAFT_383088 [Aspergillus eucalypticola CBS 122712]PWY62841.1 hypothetical protein BO83DRAFT_383088 [Aspergillus eucalypticola CBS 122712]
MSPRRPPLSYAFTTSCPIHSHLSTHRRHIPAPSRSPNHGNGNVNYPKPFFPRPTAQSS